MNRSSSKNQARIKAGIPSLVEVEYSREWQNKNDNLIFYGDQIAIRVCDGTYWQVNRDDSDKVMALARHIKDWEIVEIVSARDEFVAEKGRPVRYNEDVAFRFLANNSFIGSDLHSENNELSACVPWVKEWETFTLVEHPQKPPLKDTKARYGSWFALRTWNGNYIMFDKDNSKQLLAHAQHIDEWESFVFIHPSMAK